MNFLLSSVNESSQNIKWKSNLWCPQRRRRNALLIGRDDENPSGRLLIKNLKIVAFLVECLRNADWLICKWRIRDGGHTCCLDVSCLREPEQELNPPGLSYSLCQSLTRTTFSWRSAELLPEKSAPSYNVIKVPQCPSSSELFSFFFFLLSSRRFVSLSLVSPVALLLTSNKSCCLCWNVQQTPATFPNQTNETES